MREKNLYPPSPLTDDKNQDFSVILQFQFFFPPPLSNLHGSIVVTTKKEVGCCSKNSKAAS